jgi:replicative DNA helicase
MNIDNQILAGMVNSATFLDIAMSKLKSDYFDGDAKVLFESIQEMYSNKEQVDLLNATLKVKDKIPAHVVMSMTSDLINEKNYYPVVYAKIEEFLRRDLEMYSLQLQGKIKDEDIFDISNELKDKVKEVEETLSPEKQKGIKDIIKDVFAEIDQAAKNNGVIGAETGYKDLDRVFHGLRSGELIVIAGRPAMGKTTLATEITRRASKKGQKILFFTMEMGENELMKKLLSAESKVEHDKLISGKLHQHEWEMINLAAGDLMQQNIIIHNKGGINEVELCSVARKQKRENDIDLIVIDYLQLMTTADSRKEANLNQKIGYLSGQMKALAMDLGIPVVLLSQLSRAVETRGGDMKPILSDLRDSGSIEQDANMVWFVYRPAHYGIETTNDGQDTNNYLEVIVSKNRRGRLGTIPMRCYLDKSLIEDYEE